MGIIHAHRYLLDQSLAASFVGPWIDCSNLGNKRLDFTASWTAVALTDGDFYLEGSGDPRAEIDKIRGTSTAIAVPRTIPDGSFDGEQASVSGKLITINANAGEFQINLTDVPAFIRLGYTRRAGGGAAQLQVMASGD